tara:strand:+ start:18367 stop:19530 length:1164 start_codon:yes stop_codon:yes gene_type:complete
MTNKLNNLITESLNNYKANNLYRSLNINNNNILNFCDNDYLGLRNNKTIQNLIKNNLSKYPIGSGASHLISGHHDIHTKLENLLCDFTSYESTLLCSTGYMANLAIITALNKITNKKLYLYHDRFNHASLIDATLLNNINFSRYKHNDLDHLELLIQKNQNKLPDSTISFIVTEGLFSMDGDRPDLEKLLYLKKKYNLYIILDNAHDFLVNIDNHKLIKQTADIYMATLSKAAGGFGAFVAGSQIFTESLRQFARSYIYTTAISPLLTYANYELVKEAINNNEIRTKLNNNIKYFTKLALENNININININIINNNLSHIQPILINNNEKALRVSENLKNNNILITAIRYPTVPKNLSRLRVTLSARHNYSDIENLIKYLHQTLRIS